MSVNDFEKKVQQQMEELKLSPSAEVWQQVAARIREKKRRRFIFWLLLPGLLLGGGAIVFISLQGKKKIIANEIKHEILNDKNNLQQQENKNTIDLSKQEIQTQKENKNNSQIITKKNRTDLLKSNNTIKKTKEESEKDVKKNIQQDLSQKDIIVKSQSPEIQNIPDQNNDNVVENKKENKAEVKTNIQNINATQIEKQDEKKNDSLDDENKPQITEMITLAREEKSDSTKKEKKEVSKKIKWGFTVQVGQSNTPKVSDLFNFSPVNYADAFLQSGGSGQGINSSKLRPGFSFGINFFIQKKISEKLELNIGAGYSYLSTHINIGRQVDSMRTLNNNFSVNNYYRTARPDTSKNYTNHFHLLDVSATLSWYIVKNKKWSMSWDNAITISRLLASDALHYSSSLQGYYKNFDLFAKTHFFLSTGLSMPILNNGKIRVMINPFAAYSLTPVLKNNDPLHTHFTNYGVRFKFLLAGKK